jgi:hypothetical protein
MEIYSMSSAFHWPHVGCAGLWHFEGNGNDSSGAGHNGTAYGISYIPGKFWQCAAFAGSGRYTLPYTSILRTTEFEVLFWIKTTSTPPAHSTIFSVWGTYSGDGGNSWAGYEICEDNVGRVYLALSPGGYWYSISYLYSQKHINDGKWHHVVVCRDDNYSRIYIDGVLDSEAASPASPGFYSNSYSGAAIGAEYLFSLTPPTLGYYFIGYIDELVFRQETSQPNCIWREYAFQRGLL